MGRKIPGKKHRRANYPEKQIEKREAELKLKVNSAPKNIEDQELPKKMRQISQMNAEAKIKVAKEPKIKKDKSEYLDSSKHMGFEMKLPGMKKDLKPIPIFQQQPGEKPRSFFRRMNQQVSQFLQQKQYEAKYNVDLVQDPTSGKTKFVEREKDELDQHVHELKAKKLAKKGIILKTKEEKRQAKRLKEKEKRQKKKRKLCKQITKQQEDFADLNDSFKFNDVVQEPPKALKGIKNNEARRPGKNKDLLMLNNNQKNLSQGKKLSKEKETKTKKKVKQRISLAKKQMLETDRQSIVEQYRALKGKNKVEF